MKSIITTCLACALIITLGATTSQAKGKHHHGDEALAALGGFAAGVIIRDALDNDYHQPSYRYAQNVGQRQIRYANHRTNSCGKGYGQHYGKGHGQYHGKACSKSCGGGYWKKVPRRVWVPGGWGFKWSDCGNHRIRYRKTGHFKVVYRNVWVAGHSRGCRYH